MGSSLEYKNSVTCMDTKVAWYSPCVRRRRGGVSASIEGGRIRWVVDCVLGRGFFGCDIINGV